MSIPRIYQAVTLVPQAFISLDERASHYLSHVLRLRVKDPLVLFNGQGGEYMATVAHIDKKGVKVEVQAFLAREVESPLRIYLAQGIARGEKMDVIVQKAVELGVHEIIPVMTERSQVKWNKERAENRRLHWQSVVYSACEQSGRNHVPQVLAPLSLKEWLPSVRADKCFVLSLHEHASFALDHLPNQATIVLLIGPEGGLSPLEMQQAKEQGFLPLNLGPRILRTETASLAALATLQYHYGDLSLPISGK